MTRSAPALVVDSPTTERLLSAEEAAQVLGVSRATFYRLPYFWTLKVRVSRGRVAYDPADVRRYILLQRGAPRAA